MHYPNSISVTTDPVVETVQPTTSSTVPGVETVQQTTLSAEQVSLIYEKYLDYCQNYPKFYRNLYFWRVRHLSKNCITLYYQLSK